MQSMAVFEAPPVPACWQGGEIIRIVDPLGLQVAWVAPALAGGIVGYYARATPIAPWVEFLTCAEMPHRPAGSALLVRDRSTRQVLPAASYASQWSFETRDPTQVSVFGRIDNGDVHISLGCEDGELRIEVESAFDHGDLSIFGLRFSMGQVEDIRPHGGASEGVIRFVDGDGCSVNYQHSPDVIPGVHVASGQAEDEIEFVTADKGSTEPPDAHIEVTLRPQFTGCSRQ